MCNGYAVPCTGFSAERNMFGTIESSDANFWKTVGGLKHLTSRYRPTTLLLKILAFDSVPSPIIGCYLAYSKTSFQNVSDLYGHQTTFLEPIERTLFCSICVLVLFIVNIGSAFFKFHASFTHITIHGQHFFVSICCQKFCLEELLFGNGKPYRSPYSSVRDCDLCDTIKQNVYENNTRTLQALIRLFYDALSTA
ncbi:hypothetical protein ANN_22455 [Periplaneta americana]|uniref:Uncharacterized protein n=1 Tax=Periplaneta americana TaxID=6978 RepID=A0ABQ8S871_PERAM|nr:hypothetical protein ANN_22455 [Periplaneta americana]